MTSVTAFNEMMDQFMVELKQTFQKKRPWASTTPVLICCASQTPGSVW